jgi:hypothetical protein
MHHSSNPSPSTISSITLSITINIPLLQHDAIHTRLHQGVDARDLALQQAQGLGDFENKLGRWWRLWLWLWLPLSW